MACEHAEIMQARLDGPRAELQACNSIDSITISLNDKTAFDYSGMPASMHKAFKEAQAMWSCLHKAMLELHAAEMSLSLAQPLNTQVPKVHTSASVHVQTPASEAKTQGCTAHETADVDAFPIKVFAPECREETAGEDDVQSVSDLQAGQANPTGNIPCPMEEVAQDSLANQAAVLAIEHPEPEQSPAADTQPRQAPSGSLEQSQHPAPPTDQSGEPATPPCSSAFNSSGGGSCTEAESRGRSKRQWPRPPTSASCSPSPRPAYDATRASWSCQPAAFTHRSSRSTPGDLGHSPGRLRRPPSRASPAPLPGQSSSGGLWQKTAFGGAPCGEHSAVTCRRALFSCSGTASDPAGPSHLSAATAPGKCTNQALIAPIITDDEYANQRQQYLEGLAQQLVGPTCSPAPRSKAVITHTPKKANPAQGVNCSTPATQLLTPNPLFNSTPLDAPTPGSELSTPRCTPFLCSTHLGLHMLRAMPNPLFEEEQESRGESQGGIAQPVQQQQQLAPTSLKNATEHLGQQRVSDQHPSQPEAVHITEQDISASNVVAVHDSAVPSSRRQSKRHKTTAREVSEVHVWVQTGAASKQGVEMVDASSQVSDAGALMMTQLDTAVHYSVQPGQHTVDHVPGQHTQATPDHAARLAHLAQLRRAQRRLRLLAASSTPHGAANPSDAGMPTSDQATEELDCNASRQDALISAGVCLAEAAAIATAALIEIGAHFTPPKEDARTAGFCSEAVCAAVHAPDGHTPSKHTPSSSRMAASRLFGSSTMDWSQLQCASDAEVVAHSRAVSHRILTEVKCMVEQVQAVLKSGASPGHVNH